VRTSLWLKAAALILISNSAGFNDESDLDSKTTSWYVGLRSTDDLRRVRAFVYLGREAAIYLHEFFHWTTGM
jgi:hypothetical protein